MGLFDALLNVYSGGTGQFAGAPVPLLAAAMDHFSEQPEGVQSLVDQCERAGLGPIVRSWIANGPNLPISPDQLRAAVGLHHLQQVAGRVGMSEAEATPLLARALPELVDRLTPGGRLPSTSAIGAAQNLFGNLGGLFGKK